MTKSSGRSLTWLWVLSIALASVVSACGAEARQEVAELLAEPTTGALDRQAVEIAPPVTVLDGPLTIKAYQKDREVQPASEQTFEFLMANNTPGDLPVEIWLEHLDGARWRTSLCVEKQCLLGDGSKASVSDPVNLPPYVELPFQAHLFVDGTASSGQFELLALRVQPLVDGVASQVLTLRAVVAP
jgi:hypothetical protein